MSALLPFFVFLFVAYLLAEILTPICDLDSDTPRRVRDAAGWLGFLALIAHWVA